MDSLIIFLDDEKNVLEAYKRALHDKDKIWEMRFLTQPHLIEEMVENEDVDLIVMDLKMPGIDGMTLLEKLHQHEKGRLVDKIVVTGLEDRTLKRKALGFGAVDLLNKPVYREDLESRITNTLMLREYKKELQKKNTVLQNLLIESQQKEILGWMAMGLSFDLGNLHQIIDGITELLSMDSTLSPETKKKINVLNISSKKANVIVQKMMRLGSEDHGQPLADIRSVIEELIEVVTSISKNKSEIIWNDVQGPLYAKIEANLLFQILITLVKQSIDNTTSEKIGIWCEAVSVDGSNYLKLKITDLSIKFSFYSKLLDDNYKFDGDEDEKLHKIMESILKSNHCRIDVQKQEDSKTTIELLIPGI